MSLFGSSKDSGSGRAWPPKVSVAAFGKHPAWAEHQRDLGAMSPGLAGLCRVLYLEGVSVLLPRWRELAEEKRCPYNHWLAWQSRDAAGLARIVASADLQGRAEFPFVIAVEAVGCPLPVLLRRLAVPLENFTQRCQRLDSKEAVRAALETEQGVATGRLIEPPTERELAPPTPAERAAFFTGTGLDAPALGRALHTAEPAWAPYAPATGGRVPKVSGPGAALRLPLPAGDAPAALPVWEEFVRARVHAEVARLYVAPAAGGWVDVIVGEPQGHHFFGLQASRAGLGVETDVPHDISAEGTARAAEILAAWPAGAARPAAPAPAPLPAPARLEIPAPVPPASAAPAFPPPAKAGGLPVPLLAGGAMVLLIGALWGLLRLPDTTKSSAKLVAPEATNPPAAVVVPLARTSPPPVVVAKPPVSNPPPVSPVVAVKPPAPPTNAPPKPVVPVAPPVVVRPPSNPPVAVRPAVAPATSAPVVPPPAPKPPAPTPYERATAALQTQRFDDALKILRETPGTTEGTNLLARLLAPPELPPLPARLAATGGVAVFLPLAAAPDRLGRTGVVNVELRGPAAAGDRLMQTNAGWLYWPAPGPARSNALLITARHAPAEASPTVRQLPVIIAADADTRQREEAATQFALRQEQIKRESQALAAATQRRDYPAALAAARAWFQLDPGSAAARQEFALLTTAPVLLPQSVQALAGTVVHSNFLWQLRTTNGHLPWRVEADPNAPRLGRLSLDGENRWTWETTRAETGTVPARFRVTGPTATSEWQAVSFTAVPPPAPPVVPAPVVTPSPVTPPVAAPAAVAGGLPAASEAEFHKWFGEQFAWIPFAAGAAHPGQSGPGFWAARHEVSQAEFEQVMQSNPSPQRGGDLPVANITLEQAQEFCARLNLKYGVAWRNNWGFRLPVEAEWNAYSYNAQTLGAVFGEPSPRPVTAGAANPLRLHHVVGNVAELLGNSRRGPAFIGLSHKFSKTAATVANIRNPLGYQQAREDGGFRVVLAGGANP